MKKYLPFQKFTLRTRLSKEQVIEKLEDNVEAVNPIGFGSISYSSSKPYIGIINGDSFKIQRVINYKNALLPIITVKIIRDNIWTKIHVSMKIQESALSFLKLFFGILIFSCISSIYVVSEVDFNVVSLSPFVLLILVSVLVVSLFRSESSKSKQDLMTILEAKIDE